MLSDLQLQYRTASHGIAQLAMSNHFSHTEKLILFRKLVDNLELLLHDAKNVRDNLSIKEQK